MERPKFPPLDRRSMMRAAAAVGGLGLVSGCAILPRSPLPAAPGLAPIRARADRIFDITVCLRPFRAQGPRLDVEHVGNTAVVHNYGHGGSGWSLSWGSSTVAVERAMSFGPRAIAVIGCGALGLTSAILARNAGAQVTIYAREVMPDTRSSRATGVWSPDSRIALADKADPAFPELWERMARTSFHTYHRYLGLPGNPVEWLDQYFLRDNASPRATADVIPEPKPATPAQPEREFASYIGRIRDLTPHSEELEKGATPFPTDHVRRSQVMTFNVANYGHTLLSDFLLAGGKVQHAEFHAPADIAHLKEKVVINCTGYGARALWKDDSVTPVRGQLAWLVPQEDARYALYYNGVGVVSRRDGIVVQALAGGDMRGYGDDNETADRGEAEKAVAVIAGLSARMKPSAVNS